MTTFVDLWKQWARRLKTETYTLYLAYKDPRTPWYVRLFACCVVGYAFSPIDLIPDFIPVLGYLDDLLLVPLGVALVLKMIPCDVLVESRSGAVEVIREGRPINRTVAVVIVAIWLLLAAVGITFVVNVLVD